MLKNTFGLAPRRLFSTSKPAANLKNFTFMGSGKSEASHAPTVMLEKQTVREFNHSELYDPFDFSLAKIKLEKKLSAQNYRGRTFFNDKKVNPLDLYTNTKYLSTYLTSTGRILPREVTKLSLKNQKRLAKAIKRARSAGLLSSVHKDVDHLQFTNDFSVRNH